MTDVPHGSTPADTPTGFYAALDPDTLAAARRGEPRAFASIYRTYGRAAFNLALRILGDEAGAADVVQDVFVRLMTAIRHFRGDSPFGAWLKRMVANATVDELRRRRWLVDDEMVLQAASEATVRDVSPDASAEAYQLLMRLKPTARAVVVLHQLEGYTHRELGELFGQSESYSKSILSRTLEQLREEPT